MFHCTGKYELNRLTLLPMCGFIAQLVEHRTGIAEAMGSDPVEALIFFRILLSNCLNWKIYWDDHTSLSVTWTLEMSVTSSKKRKKRTKNENTTRNEQAKVGGKLKLRLSGIKLAKDLVDSFN